MGTAGGPRTQFRFGLFSDDDDGDDVGWVGYYMSNSSGTERPPERSPANPSATRPFTCPPPARTRSLRRRATASTSPTTRTRSALRWSGPGTSPLVLHAERDDERLHPVPQPPPTRPPPPWGRSPSITSASCWAATSTPTAPRSRTSTSRTAVLEPAAAGLLGVCGLPCCRCVGPNRPGARGIGPTRTPRPGGRGSRGRRPGGARPTAAAASRRSASPPVAAVPHRRQAGRLHHLAEMSERQSGRGGHELRQHWLVRHVAQCLGRPAEELPGAVPCRATAPAASRRTGRAGR